MTCSRVRRLRRAGFHFAKAGPQVVFLTLCSPTPPHYSLPSAARPEGNPVPGAKFGKQALPLRGLAYRKGPLRLLDLRRAQGGVPHRVDVVEQRVRRLLDL